MANNNTDLSNGLLNPALFGAAQTVQTVLGDANVLAGSNGSGASNESIAQLSEQLVQLQTVSEAQVQSTQENTRALEKGTTQTSQSSGESVLGSIGSTLGNIFGSGLGISPLISGIVSLFGGGSDAPSVPALTQYAAPSKIDVNAGTSDSFPGQTFGVDYGQGNVPRPVEQSSAQPAIAAPQITVQVQALDSQSFLDHSADIAAAVRQAMLESSVLSDVMGEVLGG
jgi:hypothetical protein